MGLQLRVRHALGARMMEIEPRGANRPITVGRVPESDVQVPVGTVAPSHCVMYMEGDQWIIQDVGSSTGTYVNGEAINGPVYLNFGDVVSLGEGEASPRIEIDPLGTGRRQRAAAGPGRGARPTQPGVPETQESFYTGAAAAAAAAPQAGGGDWPVEEAGEQVLTEITLGDLEGGRVRLRRRPRRPQSYTGVTIFVALVIIVLGWIIISQVTKDDPPPVNAQPGPQDVRGGGRGGGKNIFDFPEDQKPRSDGGGAAPMPAGQVPVAAAKEDDPVRARLNAAAPEDPRKQTDEWKAVVEANSGSERPGKALWTIVDYRRLHPGQFEEELKQYEEAAFDRLWWERIKELMELRESLAMEIDKKNIEIAQETEVGFKERLVKERERLEERRKGVGEVLVAEMGYQGREVPNLFDSGQIAKLRAQRIAETYEGWKRRVTSSLQRTRNLPWERTR